jgi:hypothetical protein
VQNVNLDGGISCTSRTFCLALGSSLPPARSYAEAFNGTSWSLVKNPTSLASDLSCVSRQSCVAVGSILDAQGNHHPLIERYNGKTWSTQGTPATPTLSSSWLNAISCPSPSFCAAVGYGTDTAGYWQALSETLNHGRWVVNPRATGDIPNSARESLLSISCPTTDSCVAVGLSQPIKLFSGGQPYDTLIETLRDGHWSITASPNPPAASELLLGDVSCLSVNDCTTIGLNLDDGPDPNFTETARPVPPEITLNPHSVSAAVGARTCFLAAANGLPAPAPQWLVSSDRGIRWQKVTGALRDHYCLIARKTANGYEYRTNFKNIAGSKDTLEAHLSIQP